MISLNRVIDLNVLKPVRDFLIVAFIAKGIQFFLKNCYDEQKKLGAKRTDARRKKTSQSDGNDHSALDPT